MSVTVGREYFACFAGHKGGIDCDIDIFLQEAYGTVGQGHMGPARVK